MKPKRFYFHSTALFGTPLRYGAPVFIGFTVLISGLTNSHAAIYGVGPAPAGAGATPAAGGASPTAPPVATDGSRANVNALLLRTNQAVGAALALQNAARAAALASPANNAGANPNQPGQTLPNVPNGLGVGGLQVAPGVGTDPGKWIGANLPTQTLNSGGKTEVTIKQTTQQALLSWQTLNVGKETTLKFDQSAGGANTSKWIAFNKINDPTGSPTQILGNIKADGQIYIINQNGIIFGGSSQVNARGLTVSSLPINDNLIERGLLNNPAQAFLFNGLGQGKIGDVTVQAGAQLTSPTNEAKVGGRIALIGANVSNAGTISTADGQTILAAGLQVGLIAHPGSDPTLRGLDVYVGHISDPASGLIAGVATNTGIIESARGSITVSGREINQLGILKSSTSASLNGRIDLLAHYSAFANPAATGSNAAISSVPFLYRSTGTINLGSSSIIQVLPELGSKETTIGTELALRTQVNIAGKAIYLGKNSILHAPNAIVNMKAGEWILSGTAQSPISNFTQSTGQIYLDENALVDVSGSFGVAVPVSQNIVTVQLRGAELANSPLQRLGVLRNQTVSVDIRDSGIYKQEMWVGTPLADLGGFANLIQKTVGELTVAGGTVTLSAGKSVVMQRDSQINVSGGSIDYQAGSVKTTLLSTNGRLVDIRDARPDVLYDGIYGGTTTVQNQKFGVSETFVNSLVPGSTRFEEASTVGAAGGSLAITAPSMALDGVFKGQTITGTTQIQTPPNGSTLRLSFLAQDRSYVALPLHSPTPPTITFRNGVIQNPVGPFLLDANGDPQALPADRMRDVFISPDAYSQSGFGSLTIDNNDGDIVVPLGVKLTAPVKGSISFNASNITINGGVSAAGGQVAMQLFNLTMDQININRIFIPPTPPSPGANRGRFSLGANGVVSTAGLIVDDRLGSPTAGMFPSIISGGTIDIKSYTSILATGGLLDVSGGVLANSRGAITYGDGGALSIAAGYDLNQPAVIGGQLLLGSTLAGYSGARAGKLSLQAPAFQVAGLSANLGVTGLTSEFFDEGGFGTFSLIGSGLSSGQTGQFVTGVYIAPEARIRPLVKSLIADLSGESVQLRPILREEGTRTPGSISFKSSGLVYNSTIYGRGDVILAKGALIQTDGRGAVSFQGDTVSLLGSVIAPGGSINAGGANNPQVDPDQLLPTTLIGDSALLSTAGKTVLTENPFGLRFGEVLAGGRIILTGNIVADRGAILDVSGASGTLDLSNAEKSLNPINLPSLQGKNFTPVSIESNGGSISFSGARMLYSDATLMGRAGGASALGGSVGVSSGKFVALGRPSNTAEANLVVRQEGFLLPEGFISRGLGAPLTNSAGLALPGIGSFAVSSIKDGGFDSLSLNGNVRFEGDVSIKLPGGLSVGSGGVIHSNALVSLEAGYIKLGQAFRPPALITEPVILFLQKDISGNETPFTFAPVYGAGQLRVKAGLIDVGNLSLQGIGKTSFDASIGDLRGNGTLSVAGDLSIKAGQVYPTTAGTFNIFAYDHLQDKGSVSILGGSNRSLPYSAGGNLSIHASLIHQAGILRAPIGTINLGWNGTGAAPVNPIAGNSTARPVTTSVTLAAGGVTSVSAIDPITNRAVSLAYGTSLDGKTWIDPAGNDITISGAPAKNINLSAQTVTSENGSLLDLRGGGDLYAYRWISGNGGRTDVLGSSGSFALIPGYGFGYAPYAPFGVAATLGGDSGYTNSSLKVGDQITLGASNGLSAGTYTLLPARYALIPGAFLLTPQSGVPAGTVKQPDGSNLVSGYRSNNLDPARIGQTRITQFEIANSEVVRQRSEYQNLLANTVLKDASATRGFTIPRLPIDSGYLSFSAISGIGLRGGVSSAPGAQGRGSIVDINSPVDILINATGNGGKPGDLVLSAGLLNSFGAESLLIGGLRNAGGAGVNVSVSANNLMLDNAGSALLGSDIIFVAKQNLRIADDALINATGESETDLLILGNQSTPGSGNGSIVRVSGAADAKVSRFGVTPGTGASLEVGDRALVSGGSIILDSTAATNLSESARLLGKAVTLSSGEMSLLLENAGLINPTSGLVLSGAVLASIQSSAKSLSLRSYSSLNVYGEGTVGSLSFEQLSLQASAIRGLNTNGGTVIFASKNLIIGNPGNITSGASNSGSSSGTIRFNAEEVILGANDVRIEGFEHTSLLATKRVITSGIGSFRSVGSMSISTPTLTGAGASKYSISALDSLELKRSGFAPQVLGAGGLGADLTLQGSSVKINGDISLPSGSLTLRALAGDLLIGDQASTKIDLGGTQTQFVDVIRYTSGGKVNLAADNGSVKISSLVDISVSARSGGGNAGSIRVQAPKGFMELAGSIKGNAGANGVAGGFALDASTSVGGSLAALDLALNVGGFTSSRDYRFRTGDLLIDGLANSKIYRVATDSGGISVSGTINASGNTGGIIDLKSNGSLTLRTGAILDASALSFDAAGKGGSIILEAGNQRIGAINSSA